MSVSQPEVQVCSPNIYNTPYFDLPDKLSLPRVNVPQEAYPQVNRRWSPRVFDGPPSVNMEREAMKRRSATLPERYPRPDIQYKSRLHSGIYPMNRGQVSPPASSNFSYTALSELRTPPANLQKSRRRCIDFGLGRTPAVTHVSTSPFLCPDDCDVASLPLEHGHESDSSSLFDDIEMVFPQPPPMSTSLRRVHSSPLLTTMEVRTTRNVIENPWGRKFSSNKRRSVLANTTPAQASHWSSWDRSDVLLDELELELEEALLSSKASMKTAIQNPPLAFRAMTPCGYRRSASHVSIILSAPESQRSISFLYPSQTQTNDSRHASESKELTTVRSGVSAIIGKEKKLSHARSTSSLLHTLPRATQKEKIVATFGHNSKVYLKARTDVPVAPSNRRGLEPSIGKLKVPRTQSLDCPGNQNYSSDSKRTLTYAGNQKSTKRTHISNPFAGLNFANTGLAPSRSLGSPFHHRPSRSRPVSHATMAKYPSPHVPKSFIDITPEQDVHNLTRSRTELLRKLLARTSRGVLNWGQTLVLRPKQRNPHVA